VSGAKGDRAEGGAGGEVPARWKLEKEVAQRRWEEDEDGHVATVSRVTYYEIFRIE
jgi:hypothetical protein